MKFKLKFLVRRKKRRWGEGKGPLTKEQLDYLDKCVHQAYWTYMPKSVYDFSQLNKLLEKEEKEDKNDELQQI